MNAFAIAHLRSVNWNGDVVSYVRQIDETLTPFGGVFRIHGANPEVTEGELPGHIVLIEFPSMDMARAWYHSEAYQAILALRTRHSEGFAALIEGLPEGYRAVDLLAKY
ncbi:DUF1330 domain-containing protein [Hydrogenophaga sp.]|uniref:DUF1330 domain-containing protein n=1 Tax=Hydrogenophaga sp. TaxID=1904254 RepID=UPI003F6EE768